MISIIRHIEYLLRDNDCVIVPGFGAFIAQTSPSIYKDGVITPPSRSINFNGAITHNDGLLASSILRGNIISYDRAIDTIATDVLAIKKQLSNASEFQFGRIGLFSLSDENLLSFSPSEKFFYGNLSNYGLPTIVLPSSSMDIGMKIEDKKNFNVHGVIKNALKVAASIAILVILAISLTTPIYVDQSTDYAGINTIKNKAIDNLAKGQMCQSKPLMPQSQEDSTTKAILDNTNHVVGDEDVNKEHQQVLPNRKYHIVIASFATRKQAQRFIDQSDESQLTIIGSRKSLYRVSLASGESWKEMERFIERNNLRNKYPDIWISRK